MDTPPQNDPRFTGSLVELVREAQAGRRHGFVRVRGTSMEPTLREGDWLRFDTAQTRPRLGEIHVFRHRDHWAVHRVLGAARQGGYRARGDARARLDPAVRPGEVLGRVVARGRGDRWRTLTGARARSYSLLMGAHVLFWSGLAALGRPVGLAPAIAAADRGLLRLAHRLAFTLFHPVIARPAGAPADGESP